MKLKMIFILLIIIDLVIISLSEREMNNINSKLKKASELETLKIKAMSQVEATSEEESFMEERTFSYYSKKYFKKLFSFSTPLNKCVKENCQYCCLSLNFCGSKEQCENSEKTMNILKIMFISITILLMVFLIYKIYITDPENEHTDSDKLNDNALNLLIALFINNRENRRKFKN
jgi:hypothetical protein